MGLRHLIEDFSELRPGETPLHPDHADVAFVGRPRLLSQRILRAKLLTCDANVTERDPRGRLPVQQLVVRELITGEEDISRRHLLCTEGEQHQLEQTVTQLNNRDDLLRRASKVESIARNVILGSAVATGLFAYYATKTYKTHKDKK